MDGFLTIIAGAGFRSYSGRVDIDMLPDPFLFWPTGMTVILLKTGLCSGGGGADDPGGGPLFTKSGGLGRLGIGMDGFFWMGIGGALMGGWGTGGGGTLGW